MIMASYNMSNSTVTISNAIFYDSGGEENDYSAYERLTMTFIAEEGYSGLTILFTDLNWVAVMNCMFTTVLPPVPRNFPEVRLPVPACRLN